MFRRETRKCFGVTEKVLEKTTNTIKPKKFWSASRFIRRVQKYSGVFQNFLDSPKGQHTQRTKCWEGVPHWGTALPFCGLCLRGAPFGGQPPHLVEYVGGSPPPQVWRVLGGGGPWGQPPPWDFGQGGGAFGDMLSPFVGLCWWGRGFWAATSLPPPPLLLL
jgi:hypothetical protein